MRCTPKSNITSSSEHLVTWWRRNQGIWDLTLADAGGGVAAGGAGALLQVEAAAAAADAQRVGLVPALAEAPRTLGLRASNTKQQGQDHGSKRGERRDSDERRRESLTIAPSVVAAAPPPPRKWRRRSKT